MIDLKTWAVAPFFPDARTFHNIYKLQKHVLLRHQSYLIVFMGKKIYDFGDNSPLKYHFYWQNYIFMEVSSLCLLSVIKTDMKTMLILYNQVHTNCTDAIHRGIKRHWYPNFVEMSYRVAILCKVKSPETDNSTLATQFISLNKITRYHNTFYF